MSELEDGDPASVLSPRPSSSRNWGKRTGTSPERDNPGSLSEPPGPCDILISCFLTLSKISMTSSCLQVCVAIYHRASVNMQVMCPHALKACLPVCVCVTPGFRAGPFKGTDQC